MSATIELLTYADAIGHLIDFQNANPSAQHNRQAKRAICLAYQNFRNDHQWPYYYTTGRICTNRPYDTGTVTFDLTGGGVERELTLTDGVWPDWACFGMVIIANVMYEVAARVSDTVLQLDIDFSPASDITTASDYILMRHKYPMPADYVNGDKLYTPESWHQIDYVHPRVLLVAHRYNVTSSNTPQWYSIVGSKDYIGSLAMAFYPFPDQETPIDFVYQRSARPLRVAQVNGKLNADAGDTVANYEEGSLFSEEHIGSVIRVSAPKGVEFPMGREGESVFDEERMIMDVNETGDQLTVDQLFLRPHQEATFTISDPLDIEPNVMKGIFFARSEWELAKLTRMTDVDQLRQTYYGLLSQHQGQASRNRGPRSVGHENVWSRRLAFMPSGPDVE